MKNVVKLFLLISFAFTHHSFAQKMPPSFEDSKNEPIIYSGKINTDKQYYDGRLPHAVGVHHYQVFRSNRSYPSEPGINGWTYNHQPYLAYWNDTFYLQYLAGLVQEHTPPTRILIATSKDGMHWSEPVVAFPPYVLPEIDDDGEIVSAGTYAVLHQRMGWYVAPNGKLLTLGFVGYCATPRRSPNAGNGLGRIVREVKPDGSFGPIYFIRYNRHAGWNETNTTYPFFTESKNKDFIAACNALLEDKLVSLQWWEEDRAKDGFYTIDPSQVPGGDTFTKKTTTARGAGKAFNYYRRPDGVLVGIWKNQFSALSNDDGKSWTPIVKNTTLLTSGAKTWGQQTEDGRYAIVHNQSATKRNRFPMAVLVSDDGHDFDRLFCLRGEIPDRKYFGLHKNPGVQYFRGIFAGNGNPPGDEMWNTYSVNKEDIWVSKTHVPIIAKVEQEVAIDFSQTDHISDLKYWNLYLTQWAPVSLDQEKENRFLKLQDEEPYDYALVERVFPAGTKKTIEFSFRAPHLPQGTSAQIEVQDQRGNRALQLRIDKDWLSFDIEKVSLDPVKLNPKLWHKLALDIDCDKGVYQAVLDGKMVHAEIKLASKIKQVERLVFRTGPYRGFVPAAVSEQGIARQSGFFSEDLPAADVKAPLIELHIDDIKTK